MKTPKIVWNYLENHSSESKAFCDYMMYFLQAFHVSLYFHVEYKCLSLSSAWNTNEKYRSGFLLLYFSFWWNVIYKWGFFFSTNTHWPRFFSYKHQHGVVPAANQRKLGLIISRKNPFPGKREISGNELNSREFPGNGKFTI